MGSFKQARVFQPLDLEIIDHVYTAIWAQAEAREPFRDRENDNERQEVIRKRIFAFAGCGANRLRHPLRQTYRDHARKVGFQHVSRVARLPKPLCDARPIAVSVS
jgi:hypothetical protein